MMRTSKAKRGAERGFTLIELMVAMLGGMFVSIAVFTLAKHASGFSMRQSRIADATLQNVVGFERLKADISRAGFLSSPNLVRDPNICRSATYPTGLGKLASVFVAPITGLSTEMSLNGLAPRQIVLSGSYTSADQFIARNIVSTPTGVVVYLAPLSMGMVNLGFDGAILPSATALAALARVFAPGRALRVLDEVGDIQFGTIQGVTGGANPSIQLAASPSLTFRADNARRCGIRGHGKNVVNVVNTIRYDIQNLNDASAFPQFQPMFTGGADYESTRRELVRQELDVDGNPIAGTLELIAEYAVDMNFSLLIAADNTSSLTRLTGAAVLNYAGNPAALGTGNGPQLIRAVHAWLSVRSQEADRSTGLPVGNTGAGPNLLRISVNPSNATLPPFARVRTLQSTIPLNNQARATWR
jgi:prepilin-type N-terminal cleavage/methylation domain-containing protein